MSRNAPCPCGSNLRYKNCHGNLNAANTISADNTPTLIERFLAADDPEAAEELCQAVITATPNHPEALYLMSRCKYHCGNIIEGLQLAQQAVSALSTHPLPPAREYPLWGHLNAMFSHALTGIDSAFGVRTRKKYDSWLAANTSSSGNSNNCYSSENPLVTVVIVAPEQRDVSASLNSVLRQTWRNIEVIVAYGGSDPRSNPDFPGELLTFPHRIRWLALPNAREPELADAGVHTAEGVFINVLEAGHEFAPTRIEVMARALSERGMNWGFSNAAFMDMQGSTLAPEQDFRVRAWSGCLDALPEVRTIGYAFIQQTFIAVAAGNLFFNRILHTEVGGFRNSPLWAWDFSLRALWLSEPTYVSSREYKHRIVPLPNANPITATEGRVQIEMFREYYSRACNENSTPENPFAPCTSVWKSNFLKSVFSASHVLAFSVDDLLILGEKIIARIRNRRLDIIEPGIDLVGLAYAELGLGENLRLLAKACASIKIPFAVKDADLSIKTRQADRSLADHITDELRHKCVLYCLNPDMQKSIQHTLAESSVSGRINIGYWFWELEKLPHEWEPSINDVDEIWSPTEFIAAAVRRSTSKPVILIPTSIHAAPSRRYTKAEFGLPLDKFAFLFSFDFNSFTARKNPEAVIRAFQRAFPTTGSNCLLMIKSINGINQPDKLRELKDLIDNDERIIIRDEFFSRDQVLGLQSVINSYVSLHRSEGLGLGLAECMYQGKPVIGTGYSGNLDFMNENNSGLVNYSLVAVREGEYLYNDPDFFWADPDAEHAAWLMRKMVEDASWRERIAAQGQQDIRTGFSPAATAERIRARLRAIGALDSPNQPLRSFGNRDTPKHEPTLVKGDAAEHISGTKGNFNLLRALDTAYLGRQERPTFSHLLSKSLPRSGHHHLVAVLSKLYGPIFDYCEFYQPDTSECCKQSLCTRMCSVDRISDLDFRVSMQKSHDLFLDDPALEPRPWLKYVVMVRPFREAILSETKLFLINEYTEFLFSHGIQSREILRFHEKSIYRKALELIDDSGIELDRHKASSFLRDRFLYHRGFRRKWRDFAERHPSSVAWIEYDDLTGNGRIDTLNDLVSIVGIEPCVPVADAMHQEPVMTDHDRQAERCRLAEKIMFDNRAYLDQCNEFMLRIGIEVPPQRAAR